MLQLDQFKLDISCNPNELKSYVAKEIKIKDELISKIIILKRSIDARKKPKIFYVYSLALSFNISDKEVLKRNHKNKNLHEYKKKAYQFDISTKLSADDEPPIIIGAGPAGLFCAYLLAIKGLNPIIFERGKKVEDRTEDILKFWETGVLDTSSNVQFGEGGAGTFSDGKLNTLVNDKLGRNKFVLETFVKFGAPEKILYEGKPHIGTDILKSVISNLRNEIIRLGGCFYFSTQVTDFIISNETVTGVIANNKSYYSKNIVLAIGHSARDTFFTLHDKGFCMEAKDFAVGFRIEHPQDIISQSMYGDLFTGLEPASYKLATNLENQRGVYSFCMCPGGFVVNASSEENRLVVNGMSYSKRDSKNANSAIVVTVDSRDFDKNDPLSAIKFQRELESTTYKLGNGKIPQQLWGDFKMNKESLEYGEFSSELKGKGCFSNLRTIYSNEINISLIQAMDDFSKRIKGFDRYDAILSGIESRTSSPVRINRDERFQSNYSGLYPCGEGAGYAGGITSAAMDGLKVAEAIINSYLN